MITLYNETGDSENHLNFECRGNEIDIALCHINNDTCETQASLGISCGMLYFCRVFIYDYLLN